MGNLTSSDECLFRDRSSHCGKAVSNKMEGKGHQIAAKRNGSDCIFFSDKINFSAKTASLEVASIQ